MASIALFRGAAAEPAFPPQPFPPMRDPLVVDDFANCWAPHPFVPGLRILVPLCRGLSLAWAPFPEADGAALLQLVGDRGQVREILFGAAY